jgi:hypothetical protein
MNTWIILDGCNMLTTVHTEQEANAYLSLNNRTVLRRNSFIAGGRFEVSLIHVNPLSPQATLAPAVPTVATQSINLDRDTKVNAVLHSLGELLRG